MSTLAERPASATYEQFYGEVPVDQIIAPNTIRVLSETPLNRSTRQSSNEQRILFDQARLFQNAQKELMAASLLQERFGVPLCLAAVQPFLILLSKKQEAIDWERMSALQLIDQLQNLTQLAFARLAEIETLRRQKEEELTSLLTATKDLQTDVVHESVSSIVAKTKLQTNKQVEQSLEDISALQQESASLEKAVMELFAIKSGATTELNKLSVWQTPVLPT